LFVAYLTRLGFAAPWSPNLAADTSDPLPTQVALQLSPEQLAGAEVFQYSGCRTCHRVGNTGGLRGPDLTDVGDRLTPSQLTIQVVNGNGNMPAFGGTLSGPELQSLVSFLASLRTPSGEPAQPPPVATVVPSSSPP
jgi:ubiquinol-cytochrome c reductase cytochrome b subunit